MTQPNLSHAQNESNVSPRPSWKKQILDNSVEPSSQPASGALRTTTSHRKDSPDLSRLGSNSSGGLVLSCCDRCDCLTVGLNLKQRHKGATATAAVRGASTKTRDSDTCTTTCTTNTTYKYNTNQKTLQANTNHLMSLRMPARNVAFHACRSCGPQQYVEKRFSVPCDLAARAEL